jgi:glycosyltransferase involved in cell wall biosynthesis
MILILVPTHERESILPFTLRRLKKQSDVSLEIAVIGDRQTEKDIAINEHCTWLEAPNDFLGAKLNRGVEYFKQSAHQYLSVVGSDDWHSHEHFTKLLNSIGHAAMIGVADSYFLHFQINKLHHFFKWSGYQGERSGEPHGTGRLYTRESIERMGWKYCSDDINRGIDRDSFLRLQLSSPASSLCCIEYLGLTTLSISGQAWKTKRSYNDMKKYMAGCIEFPFAENREHLQTLFPELTELENALCT